MPGWVPCCCDQPPPSDCSGCLGGTTPPAAISLVLAGFNEFPACDFSPVNGTHIATATATPCEYSVLVGSGGGSWTLRASLALGTLRIFSLESVIGTFQTPGAINCDTFSGLNVPNTDPAGGCYLAGATVTASAA